MSKPLNLLGQKFGRLVVIERAENNKHGQTRWKCKCDCGKFTVVAASDLKNGKIKSCGCLSHELTAKRSTKHGLRYTPNYKRWLHIKDRCLNPHNKDFNRYGGRGIKIYEEWVDDFKAFHDYVSILPHFGEKGYSLDRIDNDGNYEPNNLRWATKKQQANNREVKSVIEFNGEKFTLKQIAKKIGIGLSSIHRRIKRGDTMQELFRPPRTRKNINK